MPLDFEIDSKMPLGMGVSSSAAIEVATLRALTAFLSLSWSGTELARLAPSGVKHRVGASPYAAARCAAFMGKKILECELKRTFGYLAEVRVSEFVKVPATSPYHPGP